MIFQLSHHAEVRSAQRSIPKLAIDLILEFGKSARVGGADSYALDKKGHRRLAASVGRAAYQRLVPILNAYVVMSDSGEIITVAKRLRRTTH